MTPRHIGERSAVTLARLIRHAAFGPGLPVSICPAVAVALIGVCLGAAPETAHGNLGDVGQASGR